MSTPQLGLRGSGAVAHPTVLNRRMHDLLVLLGTGLVALLAALAETGELHDQRHAFGRDDLAPGAPVWTQGGDCGFVRRHRALPAERTSRR